MRGDALAFDQEAEEQVLGADVVVAHALRLFEGDLDHLFHPRRRDDLLDDDPLVATEDRLDRLADLANLDAEVVQDLCGQAITFAEKSEEQVLCPDIAVM